MKLAICWTGISGYMAACWRALAARQDVDLHVLCFAPETADGQAAFDHGLADGLSCTLLARDQQADRTLIERSVAAFAPDIVLITGWAHAPYRSLLNSRQLQEARFVMAMDTPWRSDWRQAFGSPIVRRYMKHMAAVFVAGERARQYAVHRGVEPSRLHRGMYAYDAELFNQSVFMRRFDAGWPRRFLFMGRYVDVKGIHELLGGYAIYRREHADPWPLDCCGIGPRQREIHAAEGVTDLGFVQPADQPAILAAHAALVLPSRYEPWGVVVAEAMGSGMPVICSSACGASVELLQNYYTGLEIPPGDPKALAKAFSWMHRNHDRLPAMGRNAMNLAPAFSATLWAERVEAMCRGLLAEPPRRR